jgi:hypothetical protein
MSNSRKKIIIGIVIAAVAIPLGIYTVSPLFVNTEINEPLPTIGNDNNNNDDATAMQKQFEDFMEMSEEERIEKGQQMSNEEKDMIMKAAAQTNGTAVNDNMATIGEEGGISTIYTGTFVGVNDGLHNAEGVAKVIRLNDGSMILRLENFKATNGPDLYVYLSTDNSASDFVNLGRLKGNIGNQNYNIPEGIDFSKYDAVLIWCRAFNVLFGSAELRPQ